MTDDGQSNRKNFSVLELLDNDYWRSAALVAWELATTTSCADVAGKARIELAARLKAEIIDSVPASIRTTIDWNEVAEHLLTAGDGDGE